jgi:glc operon protein GlcG
MVALPDFTPLRGGVPIVVDGQIVGAVGVSGAASAQRDEEIALAGAAALAGATSQTSSGGAVSYFDRALVAESFAKGAVLFDRGERYMVHTSHRTTSGKVEVHNLDTDIIYVIDGKATFVTGGKVLGGQATSPGEIRGESVEGGETRTIAKGDVIIVPAGTPHWFKEVPGPISYYTVKAR